MIKHILVALLALIALSGLCNAASWSTSGYSFDGNGLPEYPNEGMMWANRGAAYWSSIGVAHTNTATYNADGHNMYYYYSGYVEQCTQASDFGETYLYNPDSGIFCYISSSGTECKEDHDCYAAAYSSANRYGRACIVNIGNFQKPGESADAFVRVTVTTSPAYNLSGSTDCVTSVSLYDENDIFIESDLLTDDNYYTFYHLIDGKDYTIIFSNGAYYDFTCTGDEIFDYDACTWVYGYTCGIDTIKLYVDDGGWTLNDTESQDVGYDVYEMPIVDGEDYKISFIDSTIDGDFVVHNQTFSCTGDHVLIDFDRCQWIYPPYPPAPPYIIYLWTGYDYNIVVFRDEHGNFIENSQLAIYDKTDSQYIQRWTDASDGYTLLGARFATDHDVQLMLRTFDGVFTLDTTYPANGSAPVGEEVITTTNWTVPIKYNLNVLPVDQYGAALFDVFCGLSEYTPLDPGAFWGMDLSDQGYVAVTNCSGFAMCDIIAEKEGYADYKVEALNWTSKSALVKDYRHNVVMEEE